MGIRQVFQTALSNLLANRLRCLQAMLAMVIGVAGVVMVLMSSGSLLNMNTKLYDMYAPGSVSTFVSQNAEYPKVVTQADMEQVAQDNPEVIKAISPLVWSMNNILQLRNDDKIYETALYGVGVSYLELYPDWYVQEGRFFQYMDISREQKVCVVGSDIANELFDGDALGKTLKIWGENYIIVGVLAEMPIGVDLNGELLIPYSIARKIFGERIMSYNFYQDQYIVVANGVENMYETQLILQNMLREKTGGETGSVYDPGTRWSLYMYPFSTMSELMKKPLYQMICFSLLAAGVVLLIGCVGIMNVMLAAVQERTKEIGIRKAFGATNKDIKRQFTMEAVITSLLGGALGVVLGVAAVLVLAALEITVQMYDGLLYSVRLEDMNLLTFGIPVLAVLAVCVGIGVLSASYPAQQAAKMEIVDAINEN